MTVTEAALPSCEEENCGQKKLWKMLTKDVMEGTLSVRRAAAQYDIPPSTLHDCISGKVSAGAISGALNYLDEDEEREFVKFLLGRVEVSYPKTLKAVRVIVTKVVARSKIKVLELLHPSVMGGIKISETT